MCLKFPNPIPGSRPKLNNSRGFSVLLLLMVLPLFVALSGWVILELLQLREVKTDRQICRKTLIPAQEKVGKNISSLLDLNRTAQALRMQMMAAKTALAAAMATANAPAATAARLSIQRIQLQRRIMIQIQRKLIWGSKALLSAAISDFHLQLRNRSLETKNRERHLFNLRLESFQSSPVRLAVQKSNSPDPFPEYELTPNFTRRQTLGAKWQARFQQKAKGYKKWIPFDQNKNVQCGVSLKRERSAFAVIPAQVKYF